MKGHADVEKDGQIETKTNRCIIMYLICFDGKAHEIGHRLVFFSLILF